MQWNSYMSVVDNMSWRMSMVATSGSSGEKKKRGEEKEFLLLCIDLGLNFVMTH